MTTCIGRCITASCAMGLERSISTFKDLENFASVGFFCIWLCLVVFGVGTKFS